MMKYTSTNGNPPTPCTNFEFGQVEDYCVELLSDSISTAIPVEDTIWLLRTYPQPARDWVILEFTEGISCGDCELLVQDMTGRTVIASVDPVQRNGKVYLDISDWPVGMYALMARFGGRVLRGKLLKV